MDNFLICIFLVQIFRLVFGIIVVFVFCCTLLLRRSLFFVLILLLLLGIRLLLRVHEEFVQVVFVDVVKVVLELLLQRAHQVHLDRLQLLLFHVWINLQIG